MAKIRDDLNGVVWVVVGGDRVMLKAGDTVPSGAEVSEALLAPMPRKAGGARARAKS